MGPAFETFLTALFLVCLLLTCTALLTRPLWPRIARYFQRWRDRDRLMEEEQRQEAAQRKSAEIELKRYCNFEPAPDAAIDSAHDSAVKPEKFRQEVRLGGRDTEDPAS